MRTWVWYSAIFPSATEALRATRGQVVTDGTGPAFSQFSSSSGGWTAAACLPGGDLFGGKPSNKGVLELDRWIEGIGRRYPWLPQPLATRYARAYGSRIEILLARRQGMHDMGTEIVPGLYAAEVEYLIEHEWATCAADILWRRSKLGLHAGAGSEQVLDDWIAQRRRVA